MPQYRIKIVKSAELVVEAESRTHAEQIGRDQDSDGIVPFDMEVSVTPLTIGARPMSFWESLLDQDFGITIYPSEAVEGNFGFTGCDSDDYESRETAIEAAVLANGIVVSSDSNASLSSD